MYNYNYFNENWYNFDNNDLYRNVDIPSLFNPTVGYDNGNLFTSLYDQYKDYTPEKLTARNEREQILLDLSRMAFAAHELKLYLDLNPDDNSTLALFNDYRERANELRKNYEAKYGILTTSSDNLDQTPFAWQAGMWPWEDDFNV